MNDHHEQQQTELDWIAFRYVAGELTAEEALGFEQRLADDQLAREAVSRAVSLGLQLAASKPEVGVRSVSQVDRPLRLRSEAVRALIWASVGMAASLAVWLSVHFARVAEVGDPPHSKPAMVEVPRESVVTALAWVQLRNLDNAAEEVELSWGERDLDDSPQLETDRGPVVPAWVVDLATRDVGKEKNE